MVSFLSRYHWEATQALGWRVTWRAGYIDELEVPNFDLQLFGHPFQYSRIDTNNSHITRLSQLEVSRLLP